MNDINWERKGRIFNVQRYSIHDGPGIRTLIFTKGCPLHCKWCANPESIDRAVDILSDSAKCIGCGACARVCPEQAIQLNERGFCIDRVRCNRCGLCADACPTASKTRCGEEKTVEETLRLVQRESAFYRHSEGGVTMGGGEILMQADFVYNVLRACLENGISTAVETCGYGRWEDIERIASVTNTMFMDLKITDPVRSKELIGVDCALILDNLRRVDRLFSTPEYREKKLIIRMPIIPGMNDSEEDARAAGAFLRDFKGYDRVELLPFHNFGEKKYEKLDRSYPFLGMPNSTKEQLEPFAQILLDAGVRTQIHTW